MWRPAWYGVGVQPQPIPAVGSLWSWRQNNQLGITTPSIHGPSECGLQGMFHQQPTDENYRRFFERYSQVMNAQSWDELLIKDSPRLAMVG